jgi:hypothetical protein
MSDWTYIFMSNSMIVKAISVTYINTNQRERKYATLRLDTRPQMG